MQFISSICIICAQSNTDYHKKILKIRTPKTFAVVTLKFEQDGFTVELCIQKKQRELQTM